MFLTEKEKENLKLVINYLRDFFTHSLSKYKENKVYSIRPLKDTHTCRAKYTILKISNAFFAT